jgi:hypothetical protein
MNIGIIGQQFSLWLKALYRKQRQACSRQRQDPARAVFKPKLVGWYIQMAKICISFEVVSKILNFEIL